MQRKVIYFNGQMDQELLRWCEQYNNFSLYMKNLIRNDIQSSKDVVVSEYIKKLKGQLELSDFI